ncbi:MAG: hypothetical protein ACOC3X_00385 [Nanoarchaeota archaeon]
MIKKIILLIFVFLVFLNLNNFVFATPPCSLPSSCVNWGESKTCSYACGNITHPRTCQRTNICSYPNSPDMVFNWVNGNYNNVPINKLTHYWLGKVIPNWNQAHSTGAFRLSSALAQISGLINANFNTDHLFYIRYNYDTPYNSFNIISTSQSTQSTIDLLEEINSFDYNKINNVFLFDKTLNGKFDTMMFNFNTPSTQVEIRNGNKGKIIGNGPLGIDNNGDIRIGRGLTYIYEDCNMTVLNDGDYINVNFDANNDIIYPIIASKNVLISCNIDDIYFKFLTLDETNIFVDQLLPSNKDGFSFNIVNEKKNIYFNDVNVISLLEGILLEVDIENEFDFYIENEESILQIGDLKKEDLVFLWNDIEKLFVLYGLDEEVVTFECFSCDKNINGHIDNYATNAFENFDNVLIKIKYNNAIIAEIVGEAFSTEIIEGDTGIGNLQGDDEELEDVGSHEQEDSFEDSSVEYQCVYSDWEDIDFFCTDCGSDLNYNQNSINPTERSSCGAYSGYIGSALCAVNHNTGQTQPVGTTMEMTKLEGSGNCPLTATCVSDSGNSGNGWSWNNNYIKLYECYSKFYQDYMFTTSSNCYEGNEPSKTYYPLGEFVVSTNDVSGLKKLSRCVKEDGRVTHGVSVNNCNDLDGYFNEGAVNDYSDIYTKLHLYSEQKQGTVPLYRRYIPKYNIYRLYYEDCGENCELIGYVDFIKVYRSPVCPISQMCGDYDENQCGYCGENFENPNNFGFHARWVDVETNEFIGLGGCGHSCRHRFDCDGEHGNYCGLVNSGEEVWWYLDEPKKIRCEIHDGSVSNVNYPYKKCTGECNDGVCSALVVKEDDLKDVCITGKAYCNPYWYGEDYGCGDAMGSYSHTWNFQGTAIESGCQEGYQKIITKIELLNELPIEYVCVDQSSGCDFGLNYNCLGGCRNDEVCINGVCEKRGCLFDENKYKTKMVEYLNHINFEYGEFGPSWTIENLESVFNSLGITPLQHFFQHDKHGHEGHIKKFLKFLADNNFNIEEDFLRDCNFDYNQVSLAFIDYFNHLEYTPYDLGPIWNKNEFNTALSGEWRKDKTDKPQVNFPTTPELWFLKGVVTSKKDGYQVGSKHTDWLKSSSHADVLYKMCGNKDNYNLVNDCIRGIYDSETEESCSGICNDDEVCINGECVYLGKDNRYVKQERNLINGDPTKCKNTVRFIEEPCERGYECVNEGECIEIDLSCNYQSWTGNDPFPNDYSSFYFKQQRTSNCNNKQRYVLNLCDDLDFYCEDGACNDYEELGCVYDDFFSVSPNEFKCENGERKELKVQQLIDGGSDENCELQKAEWFENPCPDDKICEGNGVCVEENVGSSSLYRICEEFEKSDIEGKYYLIYSVFGNLNEDDSYTIELVTDGGMQDEKINVDLISNEKLNYAYSNYGEYNYFLDFKYSNGTSFGSCDGVINYVEENDYNLVKVEDIQINREEIKADGIDSAIISVTMNDTIDDWNDLNLELDLSIEGDCDLDHFNIDEGDFNDITKNFTLTANCENDLNVIIRANFISNGENFISEKNVNLLIQGNFIFESSLLENECHGFEKSDVEGKYYFIYSVFGNLNEDDSYTVELVTDGGMQDEKINVDLISNEKLNYAYSNYGEYNYFLDFKYSNGTSFGNCIGGINYDEDNDGLVKVENIQLNQNKIDGNGIDSAIISVTMNDNIDDWDALNLELDLSIQGDCDLDHFNIDDGDFSDITKNFTLTANCENDVNVIINPQFIFNDEEFISNEIKNLFVQGSQELEVVEVDLE